PLLFSFSTCCLSTKEVIFHDCIDRSDPIFPADFLSLSVGSAVIRDADLINPRSSPRNLRDKFGFDAEPFLLDSKAIQEFASKNLVTTLHIGQVQVGKHVREQCEKPVSDHMPEVNHTMSSAAREPGTKHHVSTILQDRSYKDRIFFRVILQVRILNDDQVASSCLETRTQ